MGDVTTNGPNLYAQLAYRMRASLGEFDDPNRDLEGLVKELAAFKRAHLSQPAQVDVPYDDALNDAGWAFIDAMPVALTGPIFNNVKGALKASIEKWLSTRALSTAQAVGWRHPHCGLTLTRDVAPDTGWHWSVTMPDGHLYDLSHGRMNYEQALADMQKRGVVALDAADTIWRRTHTSPTPPQPEE